jgi:hypothetical protein
MDKGRMEAFSDGVLAGAIYVGVALMWLVSDRRIERMLEEPASVRPRTV